MFLLLKDSIRPSHHSTTLVLKGPQVVSGSLWEPPQSAAISLVKAVFLCLTCNPCTRLCRGLALKSPVRQEINGQSAGGHRHVSAVGMHAHDCTRGKREIRNVSQEAGGQSEYRILKSSQEWETEWEWESREGGSKGAAPQMLFPIALLSLFHCNRIHF